MRSQMSSRRDFLQQSIACLSLSAIPTGVMAGEKVRHYQLTAEPTPHFFDDKPVPTNLWLYNRQSPGPLISATKGDILDVEFINNLNQPTTIHWHGIRNINEMDGVPDLTQAAVESGERFRYRFPLNDAGTFWYHAHNKAWEQVARGLYGPLIVRDSDEISGDRDVLIVADDWLINEEEQIDATSFGSLGHWSHGGRLGNALSINGKFAPSLPIPSAGPVRLRLINTANARILTFELSSAASGDMPGDQSGDQAGDPSDNLVLRVINIDGSPCAPFDVDRVTLGPAQRVDLEISDASQLKTLLEISTGQTLEAASFTPVATVQTEQTRLTESRPYYPQPNTANAKLVDIHMQGGAMGNLSSAIFEGEMRGLRDLAMNEQKLWAFNGHIGGYDHILAEINLGEVVVVRVWNDSAWPHSMHLHGQHFWVNSREFGTEQRPLLRDTYLMQPREKADLVFVADNPGMWLFHCHMLEHHASGMGGVIAVS